MLTDDELDERDNRPCRAQVRPSDDHRGMLFTIHVTIHGAEAPCDDSTYQARG